MSNGSNEKLIARMTAFGIQVCKMADSLPMTTSSVVLAKQVVRSGTSVGANYLEAQRSRTTKEFVNKLHIALQEAEETRHWLKTIDGIESIGRHQLAPLIQESSELVAILVASIKTIM